MNKILFSSNKVQFVMGASAYKQLRPSNLTEIAFIGRSNVGKSSLINSLFNSSSIAKTSNTPGRTRQINLFNIEEKIILADLPGYGYAKMSKSEINKCSNLLKEYFLYRENLFRVFLLIDSRRNILDIDKELMLYFNEVGKSFQIIFTKIDKISKKELEDLKNNEQNLFDENPALYPEIIYISSKNKYGIDELQKTITKIL